jgi:hypothetical protein
VKIRSPYDEPVRVPWLDDLVVNPGQVVTIPDNLLVNFVAAGWEPADKAAKDAAAAIEAAKRPPDETPPGEPAPTPTEG